MLSMVFFSSAEYFRNKETERKIKLEVARARKELFECNCCYDDECLFEDMRACTDGHLFCCKGIAQFVKTEFGEGGLLLMKLGLLHLYSSVKTEFGECGFAAIAQLAKSEFDNFKRKSHSFLQ